LAINYDPSELAGQAKQASFCFEETTKTQILSSTHVHYNWANESKVSKR